MSEKRRTRKPKSRRDPNRRAWLHDLLIFFGSLTLGPIAGIQIEGWIREGDPGPVTAIGVAWLGQIVVVWRYWRRDPRPRMLEGSYTWMPNRYYLFAHIFAVAIPVAMLWLLL